MTVGRTASGKIKKGYKLTRGGRVVKASGSRTRRKATRRRRSKR